MALAMMGGLIAATVLTLTFLPALYALAFRVAPQPGRLAQSLDRSTLEPRVERALQAAEEAFCSFLKYCHADDKGKTETGYQAFTADCRTADDRSAKRPNNVARRSACPQSRSRAHPGA